MILPFHGLARFCDRPVIRHPRTVQLWRIDALNTDRHLPASFDDVVFTEFRSLEDAGAAERLRRGI